MTLTYLQYEQPRNLHRALHQSAVKSCRQCFRSLCKLSVYRVRFYFSSKGNSPTTNVLGAVPVRKCGMVFEELVYCLLVHPVLVDFLTPRRPLTLQELRNLVGDTLRNRSPSMDDDTRSKVRRIIASLQCTPSFYSENQTLRLTCVCSLATVLCYSMHDGESTAA
jgi:hypothetical protein